MRDAGVARLSGSPFVFRWQTTAPAINKPNAADSGCAFAKRGLTMALDHDESDGVDGGTAVRDVFMMLALSPAPSDERARAWSNRFDLPDN